MAIFLRFFHIFFLRIGLDLRAVVKSRSPNVKKVRVFFFCWHFFSFEKNLVFGRHQLSLPMRIVEPIQIWRCCVIYLKYIKKKILVKIFFEGSPNLKRLRDLSIFFFIFFLISYVIFFFLPLFFQTPPLPLPATVADDKGLLGGKKRSQGQHGKGTST